MGVSISKETIEQLKNILARAPEGATHATTCGRKDYLRARLGFFGVWHKDRKCWIHTIDVEFDKSHSLDDMRTIVELAEWKHKVETDYFAIAQGLNARRKGAVVASK